METATARQSQYNNPAVGVLSLQYLVEKLAHSLIRKLPSSIDVQDLKQQGWLGAIEASHKFDPALNESLEGFASSFIRGRMIDWLRREDFVSRDMRQKIKRGEIQEISLHSIDAVGFRDLLKNQSPRADTLAIVNNLLGLLDQRKRRIVTKYFFEGEEMAEIGKQEGVKVSAISQIISRSLIFIRNYKAPQSIPASQDKILTAQIRSALLAPGASQRTVARKLDVGKNIVERISAGLPFSHAGGCEFRSFDRKRVRTS